MRDWLRELIETARSEHESGSDVADDVRLLVDVAAPLAGIVATSLLGPVRRLESVSATLLDARPQRSIVTAKVASAPAFRGEGATRELYTTIEIVGPENLLIGDVRFVWAAHGPP